MEPSFSNGLKIAFIFVPDRNKNITDFVTILNPNLVNDHSIGLNPVAFKKFLTSINIPEDKLHIVNFSDFSWPKWTFNVR